jgi:hypothetical protein
MLAKRPRLHDLVAHLLGVVELAHGGLLPPVVGAIAVGRQHKRAREPAVQLGDEHLGAVVEEALEQPRARDVEREAQEL